MIAQGVLPFQYEIKKSPAGMTALGVLPTNGRCEWHA